MFRLSVLSAVALVFVAAAIVTGTTQLHEQPIKHESGKVPPTMVQKIGFFNMSKVMKEYEQAQIHVRRLNDRRVDYTTDSRCLSQAAESP